MNLEVRVKTIVSINGNEIVQHKEINEGHLVMTNDDELYFISNEKWNELDQNVKSSIMFETNLITTY